MATVQKCLTNILTRCGEYDRAIELELEVLSSYSNGWGNNSLPTINALLEIIRLYYRKGDYYSALRQYEEIESHMALVPVNKEYRKKRLEMLCLKAKILIDMNLMNEAVGNLSQCESIEKAILKE